MWMLSLWRRAFARPVFLLLGSIAVCVGCAGRASSPPIPHDAVAETARAAGAAAGGIVPSFGANATPWKSFALDYTSQLLIAAVLSANSSVWFGDNGDHTIGEVSATGTTTRFDTGDFVFPQPTGTPLAVPAYPRDVAAGPNNTTYYLSSYGYGVMSASGSHTVYETTCYVAVTCSEPAGLEGPAGFQIAVTSDGSAWFGASVYSASANSLTPVIVRAIGSAATPIVVPGWSQGSSTGTNPPQFITLGPDGNIWFSDGQAIGKISVATNAVTTYKIPSAYTTVEGFAADIASGPDGALWVSYAGSYLLRVSTSGTITGYLIPLNTGVTFSGDQNSHGLVAGPANTLYAANGEYLISSFEIGTRQFSTYAWPTPKGGGAQTLATGADGNIWVFQSDESRGHVFFPTSAISTSPASVSIAQGATATVKVKEGNYSGKFTSGASSNGCAGATQASSTGTFTVQAIAATSSPCFVSFSDTIGSGTVYVKVTVTP